MGLLHFVVEIFRKVMKEVDGFSMYWEDHWHLQIIALGPGEVPLDGTFH